MDKVDGQPWAQTPEGKIILRLIEGWDAGLTEHGDIALCFTSMRGNDPAIQPDALHRSQYICTADDAQAIADMILRTLAFARTKEARGFDAFRQRISAPAPASVVRHWNKARGNRRMPAFDDIQQECIAPHLGHIWAFDFDAASGSFTGRLAGSVIMQSFSRSFLGAPLNELHPSPAFELAQSVLMRTVLEPACSRWTGELYKIGSQVIEGERVILPMGADPNHPDGVLGACWFENIPQFRAGERVEMLHDTVDWCRI